MTVGVASLESVQGGANSDAGMESPEGYVTVGAAGLKSVRA